MQQLPLTWLWWSLAAGLLLVITWFSLTPVPTIPITFSWSDKLFHAVTYFILMGYIGNLVQRRWLLLTAFLVMVFSGVIEVVQPFTGRHFDLYDMLANIVGCLLALVLLYAGAYQWLRWALSLMVGGRDDPHQSVVNND